MSKNRKRVIQPGAKSVAVRTKFKIGGRKSGIGIKQMKPQTLANMVATDDIRPRDKNMVKGYCFI